MSDGLMTNGSPLWVPVAGSRGCMWALAVSVAIGWCPPRSGGCSGTREARGPVGPARLETWVLGAVGGDGAVPRGRLQPRVLLAALGVVADAGDLLQRAAGRRVGGVGGRVD